MVKQSNSSFHNAVPNSLSTANVLLPHNTISTSTNPKPTRPSSLPTKSLSTRFVAKKKEASANTAAHNRLATTIRGSIMRNAMSIQDPPSLSVDSATATSTPPNSIPTTTPSPTRNEFDVMAEESALRLKRHETTTFDELRSIVSSISSRFVELTEISATWETHAKSELEQSKSGLKKGKVSERNVSNDVVCARKGYATEPQT